MNEPPITRTANPPTIPAMNIPAHKTCTRCHKSKPLDEFYKDTRAKDGLRSECKDCARAYSRAWKVANPDRHRGHSRAWVAANSGRHRENARMWREANREQHRESARAWQRANPDKKRKNKHRRRARKACGVPQRWQIHDIIPFACYWCGTNLRAYGATTHVDHVMPIALGGPADSSNEVMTCSACNQSKSSKHPLVWVAELVSD